MEVERKLKKMLQEQLHSFSLPDCSQKMTNSGLNPCNQKPDLDNTKIVFHKRKHVGTDEEQNTVGAKPTPEAVVVSDTRAHNIMVLTNPVKLRKWHT